MATAAHRKIVITGASGFVGKHLRAALAAADPGIEVIGTGLTSGRGTEASLDLTDAAAVSALVARVRPFAVVHLAAQSSIVAPGAGAAQTFAVNLGGTLNLALAVARHAPDAILLFSSSSEVYGRSFGCQPVDEEATPQPVGAYARSKLMAEQVLAEVLPPTARLIVSRAFNHTGRGQREAFAIPSFAGQIARIEAGVEAPVLRVGNLNAERDFLDVRDVVAAYVKLLEAAPRLPARFLCNVASGEARSIGALLQELRRQARVEFEVVVDPARLRGSDIPRAIGSSARLSQLTGWAPSVALRDTLAEVLDDARERVGTPARG